jgi:uncharacterized protein (DUF736 family)
MTQIGEFIRTKSGYSARVRTAALDLTLVLVSAESSDTENAPAWRIHLGDEDGPEIGAGWKHTGERAGEYIALLIDDPTFQRPIRANLFQSGGDKTSWALHWNRPPMRRPRD